MTTTKTPEFPIIDIEAIVNEKMDNARYVSEEAFEELDAAIAYTLERDGFIDSGEPLDTSEGESRWTWIDPATYPEWEVDDQFDAMIESEGNQGYYCYAGPLEAGAHED